MDFIADDFQAIGAALAKLEGRVEIEATTPQSVSLADLLHLRSNQIAQNVCAAKAAQQYAIGGMIPSSITSWNEAGLGSDFERILFDNVWDLYARDVPCVPSLG